MWNMDSNNKLIFSYQNFLWYKNVRVGLESTTKTPKLESLWHLIWLLFHMIVKYLQCDADFCVTQHITSNVNVPILTSYLNPNAIWEVLKLSRNPNAIWKVLKLSSNPNAIWEVPKLSNYPNAIWEVRKSYSCPNAIWEVLKLSSFCTMSKVQT